MGDQRKADADHLRLLSIFHFIGAGVAMLGIGFLALHFLFFHAFFDNPDLWKNRKGAMSSPREFFVLLRRLYVIFGAALVGFAIVNLLSGLFIRQRKCRTFSWVVAGLKRIHIPSGTTLGAFTFVVPLRSSVREVYGA
jgi:hypothetical protein